MSVKDVVVLPRAAVEFVGTALDDDVDRSAIRCALFGVEAVGDQVSRLDRVRGRNVCNDVRQPSIGVHGAIDAGRVAYVGNAVDVHAD